jgi:hypothetical protein
MVAPTLTVPSRYRQSFALGFNGAIMKFCAHLFIAVVVLTLSVGSATAQHTYSKAVQKACANDYQATAVNTVSKPRRCAFAWTKRDIASRRLVLMPWSMLAR